jgi:tryptophan synthase alpha chain
MTTPVAGSKDGRIERAFSRARDAKKKLLVTYLCIGDPSETESLALAKACVEAGADILELGSPFSDPTADGPVIARASERSIAAGGGLSTTLRVAAALRAVYTDMPLVLFGYYNPLYVRGTDEALLAAKQAGIDALLVVDLPFGHGDELMAAARTNDLRVIPLVAPTSTDAHVARLAEHGADAGFVYYVSVAGVTGNAAAPLEEAAERATAVRTRTGLPVVIGFGIDGPEKAKVAARGADGVVVGTAIVREIETGESQDVRIAKVKALVASLRAALDSG